MTKRRIKIHPGKIAYVALSMALAMLFTHTIAFEYLTTLRIFNFYIFDETLQNLMLWFLPGFALVGALTTLRTRTNENLILNASFGFTILLILRSLHRNWGFTVFTLIILVTAILQRCFDRYCEDPELSWPVFRKVYLSFRRIYVYGILLTLTPLSLWNAHKDIKANHVEENMEFTADETEIYEHTELADLLVPENEWHTMDIASRRALITKWAPAILDNLGVSGDDFCVEFVKGSAGTLGAFSDALGKLSLEFNDAYLAKTDYTEEEALNTVLHEGIHFYQQKAVEMYDQLLELGYKADRMPDFERIRKYKEASDNYVSAYDDYEAYTENFLEQEARTYAENTIAELHQSGAF